MLHVMTIRHAAIFYDKRTMLPIMERGIPLEQVWNSICTLTVSHSMPANIPVIMVRKPVYLSE